MSRNGNIEGQAETLLDLLIGQCADLESLLVLSRRETQAVEQHDFEAVLRLVEQRASLGDRLEVYHQQIAELRLRLGEAAEPPMRSAAATRAADLAASILAQDGLTRPLLAAARAELATQQQQLTQNRRGVSAYLQEGRPGAVACDQQA